MIRVKNIYAGKPDAKDEVETAEKDVQKITDKFVAEIDSMVEESLDKSDELSISF